MAVKSLRKSETNAPNLTEQGVEAISDIKEDHKKGLLRRILDKLNQRVKSRDVPKGECEICFETLPQKSFYKGSLSRKCEHDSTICVNCLRTHVRVQMSSEPWTNITCPFCPRRLRGRTIRPFVAPDLKLQYENFRLSYRISDWEDFQWCLKPNCHAGQVHPSRKLGTNKMVCGACRFSTCAYHHTPWHEGQTCMEIETNTNPHGLTGSALKEYERNASRIKLQQIAKLCPGCGIKIEKSGGCNYMKCPRCKQFFDWRKI